MIENPLAGDGEVSAHCPRCGCTWFRSLGILSGPDVSSLVECKHCGTVRERGQTLNMQVVSIGTQVIGPHT